MPICKAQKDQASIARSLSALFSHFMLYSLSTHLSWTIGDSGREVGRLLLTGWRNPFSTPLSACQQHPQQHPQQQQQQQQQPAAVATDVPKPTIGDPCLLFTTPLHLLHSPPVRHQPLRRPPLALATMSVSPKQSHEGIYVAIPPPLVSPLVRQLGSSHSDSRGTSTHLPTPASTNHSSFASQSFSNGQWVGSMDSSSTLLMPEHYQPLITSPLPVIAASPPATSTLPLSTPVSSQPAISLHAQLLSRLYPSFSATTNPSTDPPGPSLIPGSRSSQADTGVYSGYPVLGQSLSNTDYRHARSAMTESTRTAAATAIVHTLGQSESQLQRGDNPYIPSSLSMLFSDPEIMQVQQDEVVERAHLEQQQLRLRQRYMDSQRSFSGEDNALRDLVDRGEEGIGQGEHEHLLGSEEQAPLLPPVSTQENEVYGYEVVQDDRQAEEYHPYATVMSRHDYLAPHEPSSSSPLFPSPLTTLGGFTPSSILPDPLEEQQAGAGRIWQDYGTIGNLQQRQASMNSHLNQSHAAYYHAVSNYHYSSNEESQLLNRDHGAGSSGSRVAGGSQSHACVPEEGRWRGRHGREHSNPNSRETETDGSSFGARHWNRRQQNDRSDDSWLWGIMVSIVSCWVCCESPLACCAGCCV
ncbi:unnamed protein product [Mortierella alpina]